MTRRSPMEEATLNPENTDDACDLYQVAEWYGDAIPRTVPYDAMLSRVQRILYKGTDCGAWINEDEKGIILGTIVEGSEAELHYHLPYPVTRKDFFAQVEEMEAEASALWSEAND